MADFTQYLLQKGYSAASVKAYQYTVKKFTTWATSHNIEPEFITYQQLIQYVQHLKSKGAITRTINGYFTALDHYYNYLITENAAYQNLIPTVQLNTKVIQPLYNILTPEQLQSLHTTFDIRAERLTKPSALASAFRKKVTIGLIVYQGLDTHALAHLSTSDLNLEAATIHIPPTRKHNERTLPLQAAQLLELYKYTQEIRPELLNHFPTCDPDLLVVHGYQHYMDAHRRLMQRLKRVSSLVQSTQQIRASVITHWLKKSPTGYNLREVQYMAGHKKVYSTEAYLRSDTESLQLDIDKFHPLG